MLPLFPPNTVLILDTHHKTQLTIGNLVAYRGRKGMIIHRIIAIKKPCLFLTKGDGETQADGWITRGKIIGKVTHYVSGQKVISFNTSSMHLVSRCFVVLSRLTIKRPWLIAGIKYIFSLPGIRKSFVFLSKI